ncbi:hypothetical protein [Heliophilum fasciatum]|uniref:Uncharacterized protein n=1 Tax=Heliophilum fasciatum TaxID=35700 RepID=A0A4R2RRP5_9FIRM|nr:hypothetical protein [Heliophilum fasciatum]MCW2278709.1 hypothetical protein [Heliophilum fasciatum]TCP62551.1 hypothetical protein EDD73_12149 [Heliophilum fasciatum]
MGKVIDYRTLLAQAEGEARLFVIYVNNMINLQKTHRFTHQELDYYQHLNNRLELLHRWLIIDQQRKERTAA